MRERENTNGKIVRIIKRKEERESKRRKRKRCIIISKPLF
jgi:hypothetical protein